MAVDYTTQGLKNEVRAAFALQIVSAAAPAINTDAFSKVDITAQATAVNFGTNLTGTPNDLDTLTIRIKDNGTPAAITWGSSFETISATALPTTTVANKTQTAAFQYDAADAKWGLTGYFTN